MKPQPGQMNNINNNFHVSPDKVRIIAEAGNDNGITFNGSFLCRVYRKGVYRFDNGKLTKKIN